MVLDSIGFSATAPSTGAAAAAYSGDSLTFRNALPGSKIRILSHWAMHQTAGTQQIIIPSGHDTTRNYLAVVPAALPTPLAPMGWPWLVNPQDPMTITIVGSATAGDIEIGHLLVAYEDLPGISGRYISPADMESRAKHILTVQATIAAGTGGGWTGSEAINAESDLLKANTDYAILGMVNRVACGAIGIRAADFGNLRVSIPGNPANPEITREWFVDLSNDFGLPLIPVFNSANRANVLIDASQDENGADPIIALNLVELAS